MATQLVPIPSEHVTAITGRWANYQNALKIGIGVLVTTTRSNLQAYGLNPCSISLGTDPTPPEGWEFLASATKTNGQVVTDTVSIYPGIQKQPDNSLMLVYPDPLPEA